MTQAATSTSRPHDGHLLLGGGIAVAVGMLMPAVSLVFKQISLVVDACVAISRAESDKRTKALIGAKQAANNQTTNTQQGRAVSAQD